MIAIKRQILLLIVVLSFTRIEISNAQAVIDLESGIVLTGYNDVRIPGNSGTFFSLKNDLSPDPGGFVRLRLSYTIRSRHTLSLLYAPLNVSSTGRVPENIIFEGIEFPANSDLTGKYKFNSYRFTYRYLLINKPAFEFGLGFTAKIRDASISLETTGLSSEKTNVGFVPIINFRLSWNLNDKLGLLIDGDALAAKQGRAEDVLAAVTYRISDNLGMRAGYRLLEGGADNDEVYNFALFHYATVGLSYSF